MALLLALTALAACEDPAVTPTMTTAATEHPLPSPSTSAASATAAAVTRDDSLLDILPPDIDGAAVTPEEQAFVEAAADPDFAGNVERAAFFVAADATDLASGLVARLRPGVFSDAFFRDWRDSYDEGACDRAGGVAGNAQAELGGRPVYITSCAGGLHVYHAYLEELDAIVSALSVGERRLGERLMADLRP